MIPACGRERERGVTAVVVALVMMALCAFLALVINSGHLMSVRGQLQNATDAAALAGVRELNGTAAGVEAARTFAHDYANLHFTDAGMNVEIDREADVEIGHWDFKARAFTPIVSLEPEALASANAVLVRAGRESSRENAVSVTMGGLLGKKTADVRASSVAVLGGPSEDRCPLVPLAFSSCAISTDGGPKCREPLTFNSDINDTIGFTNLAPDASVGPPDLIDILSGSCRPVHCGDPISITNGAELTPLRGLWPMNTPVQAPVVDLPDCTFVEHKGDTKVIGFVTITITRVCMPGDSQSDPLCAPGEKSITVETNCEMSTHLPSAGGGPNYRTTATLPMLVR